MFIVRIRKIGFLTHRVIAIIVIPFCRIVPVGNTVFVTQYFISMDVRSYFPALPRNERTFFGDDEEALIIIPRINPLQGYMWSALQATSRSVFFRKAEAVGKKMLIVDLCRRIGRYAQLSMIHVIYILKLVLPFIGRLAVIAADRNVIFSRARVIGVNGPIGFATVISRPCKTVRISIHIPLKMLLRFHHAVTVFHITVEVFIVSVGTKIERVFVIEFIRPRKTCIGSRSVKAEGILLEVGNLGLHSRAGSSSCSINRHNISFTSVKAES